MENKTILNLSQTIVGNSTKIKGSANGGWIANMSIDAHTVMLHHMASTTVQRKQKLMRRKLRINETRSIIKFAQLQFLCISETVLYYENYDLDNVVTPVDSKKLQQLLVETNYDPHETQFLIEGFEQGFDIGYRGPIKGVRHFVPNLKIRCGSQIVLWNKVMKEVKLGRYAGPYKTPPYKTFIQSPIGLVPKDRGADTRLIFHLSYPKSGSSINSETPEEYCTVKYPDFVEAITRCMEESIIKPCFIAKSDMKSAFRHLGLRPDRYCLLLMKAVSPLDGKTYFFVEKALSFGVAISCSHFQRFSNAIAHITRMKTKKKLINYMDDFLFISMWKTRCDGQVKIFMSICNQIKFPISLEKTFGAPPL